MMALPKAIAAFLRDEFHLGVSSINSVRLESRQERLIPALRGCRNPQIGRRTG